MADQKKAGGGTDTGGNGNQGQNQDQQEPVNFSPRPHDGQVSHGGEEDNHLFGPTSRPEESPSFGASLGNYGFQPPPQGKAKWYQALRAAAMDPDAPDSVKDVWQLVDAMQGQSKYSTVPFGADRVGAQVGMSTGNGRWGDMQPPENFLPGERSLHGWRETEHPTEAVPPAQPPNQAAEDEVPQIIGPGGGEIHEPTIPTGV